MYEARLFISGVRVDRCKWRCCRVAPGQRHHVERYRGTPVFVRRFLLGGYDDVAPSAVCCCSYVDVFRQQLSANEAIATTIRTPNKSEPDQIHTNLSTRGGGSDVRTYT